MNRSKVRHGYGSRESERTEVDARWREKKKRRDTSEAIFTGESTKCTVRWNTLTVLPARQTNPASTRLALSSDGLSFVIKTHTRVKRTADLISNLGSFSVFLFFFWAFFFSLRFLGRRRVRCHKEIPRTISTTVNDDVDDDVKSSLDCHSRTHLRLRDVCLHGTALSLSRTLVLWPRYSSLALRRTPVRGFYTSSFSNCLFSFRHPTHE